MEKDLAQENWSRGGEFSLCSHNDCHYYIRNHGKKRRKLAIMYPDRVVHKCDSCKQKTTVRFKKPIENKTKVDDGPLVPLSSLIKEWDKVD
jgi:hypothetical protein